MFTWRFHICVASARAYKINQKRKPENKCWYNAQHTHAPSTNAIRTQTCWATTSGASINRYRKTCDGWDRNRCSSSIVSVCVWEREPHLIQLVFVFPNNWISNSIYQSVSACTLTTVLYIGCLFYFHGLALICPGYLMSRCQTDCTLFSFMPVLCVCVCVIRQVNHTTVNAKQQQLICVCRGGSRRNTFE